MSNALAVAPSTSLLPLRRFKLAMEAYIEQIRLENKSRPVLYRDDTLETQINSLALELGWSIVITRTPEELVFKNMNGRTLQTPATFPIPHNGWRPTEEGLAEIPAWRERVEQMIIQQLRTWATKATDEILQLESAPARPPTIVSTPHADPSEPSAEFREITAIIRRIVPANLSTLGPIGKYLDAGAGTAPAAINRREEVISDESQMQPAARLEAIARRILLGPSPQFESLLQADRLFTARMVLVIFWLLTDPDAGKVQQITTYQRMPWGSLDDDSTLGLPREFFGEEAEEGEEPGRRGIRDQVFHAAWGTMVEAGMMAIRTAGLLEAPPLEAKPQSRRRGRLEKEVSEAKKMAVLSRVSANRGLLGEVKVLAKENGVHPSTIQRWLNQEQKKHNQSRAPVDHDEE